VPQREASFLHHTWQLPTSVPIDNCYTSDRSRASRVFPPGIDAQFLHEGHMIDSQIMSRNLKNVSVPLPSNKLANIQSQNIHSSGNIPQISSPSSQQFALPATAAHSSRAWNSTLQPQWGGGQLSMHVDAALPGSSQVSAARTELRSRRCACRSTCPHVLIDPVTFHESRFAISFHPAMPAL
jgi:hypothetical protein